MPKPCHIYFRFRWRGAPLLSTLVHDFTLDATAATPASQLNNSPEVHLRKRNYIAVADMITTGPQQARFYQSAPQIGVTYYPLHILPPLGN